MRRRRAFLFCIALLSVSLAAPASAADDLAHALTGDAKNDYTSGIVLFKNGDYEGALTKFRSAYERSHDGRLLWNMAACAKSLRRYVQAIRLLHEYAADSASTAQDRARAADLRDTMRQFVTHLVVEASEPGASVRVDGESIGVTPLPDDTFIDLGERVVRVEKEGFAPYEARLACKGNDEQRVVASLVREVHAGRLSIAADGGAISVDGKSVGVGRWDGQVAPGSHRIRVTADGMRPYEGDLTIRDKESRTLDVHLESVGRGIPAWAWIGGGVVLTAGLAVGGYFLFRPHDTQTPPVSGTIPPYSIALP